MNTNAQQEQIDCVQYPQVYALTMAEKRDAALKGDLTGQERTDCMENPDVFALTQAEKLDAPALEAKRKELFRIKTYLKLGKISDQAAENRATANQQYVTTKAICDSLRAKMREVMAGVKSAPTPAEERKVA